ncbi:MAG TPA: anti-virulence regulator CigR family protein [Gammaproteobacteria bacterium]|nr:anti-virulence regulator CigR family protein [Gammaproteobacteria bacterium]
MYRPTLLAVGIVLAAAGCSSTPATQSGPQRTLAQASATVTAGVSVTLSTDQAAAVRAYLSSGTTAQDGRGRGRNGSLPPGIARNLERGKPLPPGIAKRALPQQLVSTLPRLPTGLDYVVVAGKLLLVEAATQIIRDVLLDIAFDA